MKKILALSIVTVAIAALSGGAAIAQPAMGGGPAYGMAGCGLGSMVIGTDPGIMQVLAATTNGTFGSQTFGITFGTSNCTDAAGGIVGTMSFIETNRDVVAKDIARGQGETIAALTALGGCKSEAAVGARLQQSYGAIFPSAAASDRAVSTTVVTVLKTDAALACSALN